MNIDNIPIIEGNNTPVIGYNLHYKLKISNFYSIRWKMVNSDGTSLSESDRGVIESKKTQDIEFAFLDHAAGKEKILEAWYRINESDDERRASISIKPVLGPPAIVSAIWQNAKKQDITQFSLETICLAIRTTNIPEGHKLNVYFYDKEPLLFFDERRKYAGEKSVDVGKNGKTNLVITRQDWLGIRRNLKNQRTFGGEDAEYQIYASVCHDPSGRNIYASSTEKVLKSTSVLTMINDPKKSLEALEEEMKNGNKSAVVDVVDTSIPSAKVPVDLRIDVYFDGTMGNRWNIDAKRAPDNLTEDGESAREKLQKNNAEHMLDEKDSSYDQVYTNIPIMFDLDAADEKKRQFKVYAEGVGSRKYGTDEVILGAGVGSDMGGTGIKSKKQRMLEEIKKNVKLEQEEVPGEVKVVVFGFSRGAATARSFLSHGRDIARILNTSEANISFEFVGIFDTVSSVFVPDVKDTKLIPMPIGPGRNIVPVPIPVLDKDSVKTARDNVKGLNLAMGATAKKVVHLTAGDEYRSFFKLTNINSSINAGAGFELELPGSHCDLGGGDADNMTEHLWDENYRGLTDRLITEGWHTKKKSIEIQVPNTRGIAIPLGENPFGMSHGIPSHIPQNFWYVERTVRAGYHKIPMNIMMHFATEYAGVIYEPLGEAYSIPDDLTGLSARLLSFAIRESGKDRASAMGILEESQFRWVRNKYLHLSAFPESGRTGVTDIVKDIVLGRTVKEGLKDWLPFTDGDYGKRPERGINQG